MTVTTLKRNKKDVLDQIKPVNELDKISDLKLESSNLKEALAEYEDLLGLSDLFKKTLSSKSPIWSFDEYKLMTIHKKIIENYKTVLTSNEINIFTKMLFARNDFRKDFPINGYFLSNLIEKSYLKGNNDFKFESNNVDYFGYLIKGVKDNPICIGIENNFGDLTAYSALYSKFFIGKHNSKAGNQSPGLNAKDSVFISPNRETLDLICAKPKDGNKFYLLVDGEEVLYEK